MGFTFAETEEEEELAGLAVWHGTQRRGWEQEWMWQIAGGFIVPNRPEPEESEEPLHFERNWFGVSWALLRELERLGREEFDRVYPGERERHGVDPQVRADGLQMLERD